MSRTYDENTMLKTKGILYFPPVKNFDEAFKIYNECGGMIISLEEDGFLVDEPIKIARLYDIPANQLEFYFIDVLKNNSIDDKIIEKIISKWNIEENIEKLEV